MSKTKEKDKIHVRINYGKDQNPPVGVDEVFFTRDPDVNEAKYFPAGKHSYKEGEFTEATVEKKEEA